jgi:hypothetical protein
MSKPNELTPAEFAKKFGLTTPAAERIISEFGHSWRACHFAVKRLKTGRNSAKTFVLHDTPRKL